MATFSINIGTNTEATAYPLVSYVDVDYILNLLIDNESKLINPVDLRDTILSLYSSSGFKVTNTVVSTKEYIGIDTLDPSDRDNKKIIFLGKRSFSGTFSYTNSDDIFSKFNYTSNGTDIYFFNTKSDTISNNETKLSILAGTSFGLYGVAPYLRSQIVSSTTSLVLDIVNTSINGNINLNSDFGTVSINDIVLPTITDSYASASNLKTFKWQDGKVIWDDITYGSVNYIGMTGVDLQIFGNPVNINGYDILLSDSRQMPLKINDMIVGSTFNQVPLVDILKRILYPYLSPQCSIRILSPYNLGYSEVGTYPTPIIEYTIIKRTLPTQVSTLTNMLPGIYPAITSPGQVTVTSTSNGVVITPITTAVTTFTINVTDGTQSASASTSIQGIYPYFYGFSPNSNITNAIQLATLTKTVESKSNKSYPFSGSGNLFFVYDINYGTLSNIYDYNGNTCSASFSYTTQVLSSPTGLWAAKQFYVYKYTSASSISGLNFQFKY